MDHYSAEFFLTNPKLKDLAANSIGLCRRLRFVGNGLHERIEVESYRDEPLRIELRLPSTTTSPTCSRSRTGFATALTRSSGRRRRSDRPDLPVHEQDVRRRDEDRDVGRRPIGSTATDLIWTSTSRARTLDLRAGCPASLGPLRSSRCMPASATSSRREGEDPVSRWLAPLPRLESDSHLLELVDRPVARDLIALRIEAKYRNETILLPAAGLPWFLTLFGRDTLITAYQTVAFGPRVARGALVALAALQGTKIDDFRDEEPGKILARVALGRADRARPQAAQPVLRHAPTRRSSGSSCCPSTGAGPRDDEFVRTHCATQPLRRWAGSTTTATATATATSSTQTRSSAGAGQPVLARLIRRRALLRRQHPRSCRSRPARSRATSTTPSCAWRSWPTVRWPTPHSPTRLRSEAADLRTRFERDFWIDARGGYYAIGLDGDKRRSTR